MRYEGEKRAISPDHSHAPHVSPGMKSSAGFPGVPYTSTCTDPAAKEAAGPDNGGGVSAFAAMFDQSMLSTSTPAKARRFTVLLLYGFGIENFFDRFCEQFRYFECER
jgi:hypothetical protein